MRVRGIRMIALGAAVTVELTSCTFAGSIPEPGPLGADYPGTCLPNPFLWASDWLEGFTSESDAVGGAVVGLRLEYIDDRWLWRVRSHDSRTDFWGERLDDATAGREALMDVATHDVVASRSVTLTPAEASGQSLSAYSVAVESGEEWPSPVIIELARIEDEAGSAWRVTLCDTETNEQSVRVFR